MQGHGGCGAEATSDASNCFILCHLHHLYELVLAHSICEPDRRAIGQDWNYNGVEHFMPIRKVQSCEGLWEREVHTNVTWPRVREFEGRMSTKNFGEVTHKGILENTGANDTLQCRIKPYKLLQCATMSAVTVK